MHIFLYEWATGGGLVECPGGLPASLAREGIAMVSAIAADLSRIEGCRVSMLRDPRVLQLALARCELVDVMSSASHNEEFERLSAEADAVLLIAPEFDAILLKAARAAVASGANLISPAPEFIHIAANKQLACELLAGAGVPVPHGITLESEDVLPMHFPYPAVIKPIDGAGSQDTYLVAGCHDRPPAYAWARRLEQLASGMAASVAALCGPTGPILLPPTRQRISDDGRFRYLGGELPIATGLAQRATDLARRAIGVLPATTGYVGIDLVLGHDPSGGEDVVIEINPRLTTSYVGLRAHANENLAKSMCEVAQGRTPQLTFRNRRLEFDPEGNVSYLQ